MSLYIDIKKRLQEFTLDIKFEIPKEKFGLLGASGCGKSMTLACIAGVETPDSGVIAIDGKVLFDSSKKINVPVQKRDVGFLFQNYALFPNMTVEDNIGSAILLPKSEKAKIISQQIKLFHLEGLEKRYPARLSGGQKQRVALARMTSYKPNIIMLDEPFSALDFHLKYQLEDQLEEVFQSNDAYVLFVSHNRDEVYKFCDEIGIISKGRLDHLAETKELFKNPETINSAILSGCKNISEIKKIDDFTIDAVEWGVHLKTTEKVTDDIKAVGIRAHMILPTDYIGENVFEYLNIKISERPFSSVVNFKLKHDNKSLICEMDKKAFNNNRYFKLPPENLLFLKNN